jgi:hypothetical protein
MNDQKSDRMIQLLEEILKWTSFEAKQDVRNTLIELLKTDTEKLIYQKSDGRTSREVAQVAGTSHGTVVNYWRKWSGHAIVEEVRSRGGTRYKRVFSLTDFGIEIPQVRAGGTISAPQEQSGQPNSPNEE